MFAQQLCVSEGWEPGKLEIENMGGGIFMGRGRIFSVILSGHEPEENIGY